MPSEPTECPTCKGDGELEGRCTCSHGPCGRCGDSGIVGLGKCPCCKGEGSFEDAAVAAEHGPEDSCNERDEPDPPEDDDPPDNPDKDYADAWARRIG